MTAIDVRIVDVPPMRVATFHGFGTEPETIAWDKLTAWARPRGLLADLEEHPIYGFNNPDPSPGSPNYGYEVWIRVAADQPADEGLELRDFEGGRYAVARCEVPKGDYEVIGETWRRLVAWREDSSYRCGSHQWLERSVPDDSPELEFVLDLHLPIRE